MTIEKDVAPHQHTLLTLATSIGQRATALAEWRKEAGAKSKWSAHTKMIEAGLFHALDADVQTACALIKSLMPDHWDSSYGMKTARMGTHIRWAAKDGKARDGAQLDVDSRNVAYWMGRFLGFIALSTRRSRADVVRLKALGVYDEPSLSYCLDGLVYNGTYLTQTGISPQDATAQACLQQGNLMVDNRPQKHLSLEECLHSGYNSTGYTFRRLKQWSVADHFTAQFNKTPSVRALVGTYKSDFQSLPWKDSSFEDIDMLMATAKRLSDAAGKGTPKPFLLMTGTTQGVARMGWNGESVIMAEILHQLYQHKMPKAIHGWRVYPQGAECSQTAHALIETTLPAPADDFA